MLFSACILVLSIMSLWGKISLSHMLVLGACNIVLGIILGGWCWRVMLAAPVAFPAARFGP